MIDISNAVFKLNSNIVKMIGDVAYDIDGNEVEYDKSAVESYVKSQEYVAKRQSEYPPITEQLDTIFHQGLDVWKSQIQEIKDKYPK